MEVITHANLGKHYSNENFYFECTVSYIYIYSFKKRHNFVSKLCHLKRFPTTDYDNFDFIDNFIDKMRNLFEQCANNCIINIDETTKFFSKILKLIIFNNNVLKMIKTYQ